MNRVVLLVKSNPERWAALLRAELPGFEVLQAPDGGPAPYSVVGKPPHGAIAALPGLRAVFSINAGVEHLLAPGAVPEGVPILRLADPTLAEGMRDWVMAQLLAWHRNLFAYREDSACGVWSPKPERLAAERRVLVLGAGSLGRLVAGACVALGFRTRAWARRRPEIPGVQGFAAEELAAAADGVDALIGVLPLTPATEGLIDAALLGRCNPGALVVNGGRGKHIVEADLLGALASGRIGFAALDVFATEPLPEAHPFWRHPQVLVTPHVAAPTIPETAARHIATNLRDHLAGAPLRDVVDRARGY